jgi:sec-independent protein translocase protein TatC
MNPINKIKLLDQARILRGALLRSALLFATLFVVAWTQSDRLLAALLPSPSSEIHFIISDVLDRLWIPMKLSLFMSLLLSLPLVMCEVFFFVSPALRPSELKIFRGFLATSPVLFLGGVALWLFFLLPQSLKFLIEMGPQHGENFFNLSSFLGFALGTSLVFGALFQLPLILRFALSLGLVSHEQVSSNRRVIYVVLSLIAAILTPSPDAFTLLAVWIPMILLFEAALLTLPLKSTSTLLRSSPSTDIIEGP